MSDQKIEIKIFRPLNGVRTPHILILDKERNVVSEDVDHDGLARIKASPYLLSRHLVDAVPGLSAHASLELREKGLHAEITGSGIVISRTGPSEWSQQFNRWLTSDKQNPFPGTEDLRQKYFAERAALEIQVAAGDCPSCDLTRLMADYRVQLEAAQEVAVP